MPGLVPGIHSSWPVSKEGVDGRDKPGHDEGKNAQRGYVSSAYLFVKSSGGTVIAR